MSAECVHGQLARSCEICERDATIERLQQETLEQARLLGAGSEREARLMARVAELGRELTAVRSSHDSLVAQRAQSEPKGLPEYRAEFGDAGEAYLTNVGATVPNGFRWHHLWGVLDRAVRRESTQQSEPQGDSAEQRSNERKLQSWPALHDFFEKYALGGKLPPSCFVCGKQINGPDDIGVSHLELLTIVCCKRCKDSSERAPRTQQSEPKREQIERYQTALIEISGYDGPDESLDHTAAEMRRTARDALFQRVELTQESKP